MSTFGSILVVCARLWIAITQGLVRVMIPSGCSSEIPAIGAQLGQHDSATAFQLIFSPPIVMQMPLIKDLKRDESSQVVFQDVLGQLLEESGIGGGQGGFWLSFTILVGDEAVVMLKREETAMNICEIDMVNENRFSPCFRLGFEACLYPDHVVSDLIVSVDEMKAKYLF